MAPIVPLVFFCIAAVLCLGNLGIFIAGGGQRFPAVGLAFLSMLMFLGGAISSIFYRRRPGGVMIMLLNDAGIILSFALAWLVSPTR